MAEIKEILNEVFLAGACLSSFAAGVISVFFFFRFKKAFFMHVLLILLAFFLISTNSFYVLIHGAITNRIFICIFGGLLSLIFSYGITSFSLDFIKISQASPLRKVFAFYAFCALLFSIISIFIPSIEHPYKILNILGIWIPAAVAVFIGIIFCKRIDKGAFRKERWCITVLAALNLILSFFVQSAPFIFIISVSILIYHIFYRFYFSSPIAKTEKTLDPAFIKDFSITKREQEIITSLLDGKSNKELAETLFVSEKTIEAHLANIYKKIGVKNRLELFSRLQNKF